MFSFFITCAPFHEGLLREELQHLGLNNVKETLLGVSFNGSLKQAYTVLLWSRLAHHLLLKVAEFEVHNPRALYHEIKKINWNAHLKADGNFRIDVLGKHSQFTHPHYLAQVAKDAIVDQFREQTGIRPDIQKEHPDVVLCIKAKNELCQVYIDLAGESLHRRGYRHHAGPAPLKETLAAALLLRAGWHKRLQAPSPILLDPFCGSGTLILEAALMAFDIAPGLLRSYFGCLKWQGHEAQTWETLIHQAQERKTQGLQRKDIHLIGYDQEPKVLTEALRAAAQLDLQDRLILERRSLKDLELPAHLPAQAGLIVTNPPYGVRLLEKDKDALKHLFQSLGEALKKPVFHHWQAYILCFEREPVKALGIRMEKAYRFKNGDLDCELLQFNIVPERFWHADFLKNLS